MSVAALAYLCFGVPKMEWQAPAGAPIAPHTDAVKVAIPLWESMNRTELRRSSYQPKILWSLATTASWLSSAGASPTLTDDVNTDVLDAASDKTLLEFPHTALAKSDGKILVCAFPAQGQNKSTSVQAWDLKTQNMLWDKPFASVGQFSEPADGEVYVASRDGLFSLDAHTGKVLQQVNPKADGDGGRGWMVVSRDYLYIDWDARSVFALKRKDLRRGKKNYCMAHPVALVRDHVVAATNFNTGLGVLDKTAEHYRSFPPQYLCGKWEVAVAKDRVFATGDAILGKTASGQDIFGGERLMCFDARSRKKLWHKMLSCRSIIPFGSHVADFATPMAGGLPKFALEIRDQKTGALQWRQELWPGDPSGIPRPQIIAIGDTLFLLAEGMLTAMR